MSDNIKILPAKKPKGGLTLMQVGIDYTGKECKHPSFIVDESKAEVTCSACKEKMNPIWVLNRFALDESQDFRLWARLKAEIKLMGERFRVKCKHCHKITDIKSNISQLEIGMEAEKIMREEVGK